jgi:ornithine carbamoyltransferase
MVARARAIASSTGGWVSVTDDPREAVAGADVVATDTWVSMGQVDEEARLAALLPYQLNAALLKEAAPHAVVLHCLPAHRGFEITDEVLDGPRSLVFQQAANRNPAQKALLSWLIAHAKLAKPASIWTTLAPNRANAERIARLRPVGSPT